MTNQELNESMRTTGDDPSPVLIVEDSPTQAYLLEKLVGELGYTSFIAKNGREALDILKLTKPILIISDILMPHMDGIELCSYVKHTPHYSDIPFILVTSLTDPVEILKALKAGADRFIPKPIDAELFQSQVAAIINQFTASQKISDGDYLLASYKGRTYEISASKQTILDLLVSAYETAVKKNLNLLDANESITELNSNLEVLVDERTEQLQQAVEEMDANINELLKTQETLRISEQRYRLLFEHAGETILILNDDDPISGSIIDCNEEAVRMYGYSRYELLNMSVFDLDVTSLHQEIRDRIKKVRQGGWISYEITHQKKDGSFLPLEIRAGPIVIEDKEYVIKFERDISDRKRIEQLQQGMQEKLEAELEATESRYKVLFDFSSDAIFIVDMAGSILDVNETACTQLEYSRDELKRMHVTEIDNQENAARVPERIQDTLHGGAVIFETEHVTKTGQLIPFEIHNRVIEYEGKPAILSVARDISRRLDAERAMKESEERFRLFVDEVTDIIYFISLNPERVLFVNPAFEKILGISPDEILNNPRRFFDYVHPDDRQELLQAYEDLIKGMRSHLDQIYRFVKTNGDKLWLHDRVFVIKYEDSAPSQLSIISEDITDRKLYEDKQLSDLKEKETLLKEIHHRVRNNLQIISSLLSLQEEKSRDLEIKEMLHENINRIRSIALVHDTLYQAENLDLINYRDYLHSFSRYLLQSYHTDPERVKIIMDFEEICVDITTAVPLSLIINEMITNSLKYAFPGDKKGIIRIRMSEKDNRYILTYCDNGIGIPDKQVFTNPQTLGI